MRLFSVARLIQINERPALRTIVPMDESVFDRKVVEEADWGEAHTVVLNAYGDLQSDFSIEYDSFGGYRLIYRRKIFVRPSTVFRRLSAGFERPVPDRVVTDLSVMSSERTGEQLILLGPVRFVNSDCEPNVTTTTLATQELSS